MSILRMLGLQFGLMLGLALLVQIYLYWNIRGVIQRSSFRDTRRRALHYIAGLAALYYCLITIYMFIKGSDADLAPVMMMYGVVYPFWIWLLPSIFILFPILLIKDLTTWIVRGVTWSAEQWRPRRRPLAPTDRPPISRRQFLRYSAASAVAAPVFLSAYGAAYGARHYEVTRLRILRPGLPSGLHGFRIIHISDIHSNLYMDRPRLEEIVWQLNEIESDMLVMTGDYVTGTADYIYPMVEAFRGIRRPAYGMYATLGNHDFYTSPGKITRALASIDIHTLRNETAVVSVRSSRLNVVGIDYAGTSRRQRQERGALNMKAPLNKLIERAVQNADPDGFDVLLSHNPMGFDYAAKRGIPLTLAGHTHGGQIVVNLSGIVISPAALRYPYVAGLYRQGEAALYVNRGCGTTGPPIRLNCTPEITVLTLANE